MTSGRYSRYLSTLDISTHTVIYLHILTAASTVTTPCPTWCCPLRCPRPPWPPTQPPPPPRTSRPSTSGARPPTRCCGCYSIYSRYIYNYIYNIYGNIYSQVTTEVSSRSGSIRVQYTGEEAVLSAMNGAQCDDVLLTADTDKPYVSQRMTVSADKYHSYLNLTAPSDEESGDESVQEEFKRWPHN